MNPLISASLITLILTIDSTIHHSDGTEITQSAVLQITPRTTTCRGFFHPGARNQPLLFNLQVASSHAYRIGKLQILAHNTSDVPPAVRTLLQRAAGEKQETYRDKGTKVQIFRHGPLDQPLLHEIIVRDGSVLPIGAWSFGSARPMTAAKVHVWTSRQKGKSVVWFDRIEGNHHHPPQASINVEIDPIRSRTDGLYESGDWITSIVEQSTLLLAPLNTATAVDDQLNHWSGKEFLTQRIFDVWRYGKPTLGLRIRDRLKHELGLSDTDPRVQLVDEFITRQAIVFDVALGNLQDAVAQSQDHLICRRLRCLYSALTQVRDPWKAPGFTQYTIRVSTEGVQDSAEFLTYHTNKLRGPLQHKITKIIAEEAAAINKRWPPLSDRQVNREVRLMAQFLGLQPPIVLLP